MGISLLKICKDFRKGLLGRKKSHGMCYAMSAALGGYLRACMGIDTELVRGIVGGREEHIWLKQPDGTIIDATADQFQLPGHDQLPKVYIGPKPEY